MKQMKRFIVWIMIFAAVLAVPGCRPGTEETALPEETPVQLTSEPVEIQLYATPTPEVSISADEIIYRMAARYAHGEEDEKTQRTEDLRLLRDRNPLAAYQWEGILAFYDDARGSEIHYGVLPDGLEETEALCIVVMGYQLNKNGSMKPELTQRLEAALKSAEKYPRAMLLCCGGGTAENSSATEADKMTEWLVGKGVDPGRIIVENQSKSTVENAKYICRELKKHPRIKELAIVSSDYHILRASVLVQARALFELHSLDEAPLRIVSNAACKTNKRDVSDAKIMKSILLLTGDGDLQALIRDEDFSSNAG